MTPDLLPEFLLGPFDGDLAPFGGAHMPRLVLPACPERQVGSPGPRVVYEWQEGITAWVFLRYMTPSESAMAIAFGEQP